jgi:hypothetical protein
MKEKRKSPLRIVASKHLEEFEGASDKNAYMEQHLQSIEEEMLDIIKLIDDNIQPKKLPARKIE